MDLQETLPDYVRRVIHEKGLNYREVARRSGGAISHGAVGHIVNGVSTDVRKDTLQALAKGLGVPEDELFAVARGKDIREPSFEHQRLIEMYEDIPPQCQKDVMDLLAVLQQNHSLSNRKERQIERRKVAAAISKPPADEADDQDQEEAA